MQIPFMADIYHGAREVVVWLGPAHQASLALSTVREIWLRSMFRSQFGGALE